MLMSANIDDHLFTESYGSCDAKSNYLLSKGKLYIISDRRPNSLFVFFWFFKSVFLPQGYPDSVSADYLLYQVWDTVQAFCSSITGSLAMQAVLKGVGVGDESATVAAATITWLLKDGTGMVGRITFAWFRGSALDCECKKWRLFADVLNDLAILLDLLAPCFENIFRIIVCISGVLRAVVGVAGGATRAAITQHQARRNNMADVAAKDGSQETLVNLVGLLTSILIIPCISGSTILVWTLFLLFATFHLIANYQAIRCLMMDTFNMPRFHIVISKFLTTGVCPNVKETNLSEPVIFEIKKTFAVHFGCSLKENIKRNSSFGAITVANFKTYFLGLDLQKNVINISLHADATLNDHLKSYFHAELIEFCFKSFREGTISNDSSVNYIISLVAQARTEDILMKSYNYVEKSWDGFVLAVSNTGWKTTSNLLGANEWRIF